MRESIIESEGTKYAKQKGWTVFKGKSPGRDGMHDRIHFMKGFCFTIEYKAPGKKATPKQRKRAKELQLAGIICRCFDNIVDTKDFIDAMSNVAKYYTTDYYATLLANLSSFDA